MVVSLISRCRECLAELYTRGTCKIVRSVAGSVGLNCREVLLVILACLAVCVPRSMCTSRGFGAQHTNKGVHIRSHNPTVLTCSLAMPLKLRRACFYNGALGSGMRSLMIQPLVAPVRSPNAVKHESLLRSIIIQSLSVAWCTYSIATIKCLYEKYVLGRVHMPGYSLCQ